MAEYRNRTTGEVKTRGQWRNEFTNVSLPKIWNSNTIEGLGLDEVANVSKPSVTTYQIVERNGVEQDSDGNWKQAWTVRNMTDAERTSKDSDLSIENRVTRDAKLAETDFYALSDVTMSTEMQTYRQALRDITSHSNWPNLSDDDWPTKP